MGFDHRQNARGKTIASVYSVRPKPGAPVSTPLRWDELAEDVTPRRFGMREALERVEQHGDLCEHVLAGGQALGRCPEEAALVVNRPARCRGSYARGHASLFGVTKENF
jgi:DNA primase